MSAVKTIQPCEENSREREIFDGEVVHAGGDVRAHIARSLRIWAAVHPGGSYAAQCKIMSNEVLKLHLPSAPDWVAVSERMPPPDSNLLVVWGEDKQIDKAHTFAKWKHQTNPLGYLIQGHPGSHNDVTHWMLHPEAPRDKAEQPPTQLEPL